MLGSMRLQEWIHGLEMGVGARYVRGLLAVIGFITVAALYDSFCFHHFENAEAMDAAQLARNLAAGKGFTTLYVRPFSISLTSEHRADRSALLKEGHRDISNAPLYPMALAPLMRAIPASAERIEPTGDFKVYLPDLLVTFLNQVLLGLGALMVFRLALKWFDSVVAWLAVALFVLTELYWRFSISGLSTMLLIDLVLVLAWLLARFEQGQRVGGRTRPGLNAVGIGLVTGLLMLTQYAMGWLIVPVLVFVASCAARRRVAFTLAVFIAFALTTAPWLTRNVMSSGWPLGTATFAAVQDTAVFPGDALERTLSPSFRGLPGHRWILLRLVIEKGILNSREIISTELPRMGGNWLSAFFLVGLLVPFQNPGLNRLRWFVMGALWTMIPVQAMARSYLSSEAPLVNSENLLVVFSPLVLVFGIGLFVVLFDSLPMANALWRYAALTAFIFIASLPMLLSFVPPRPRANAVFFYPPRVQEVASYLNEDELMMSDAPWAVAWYGQRQTVALTADWKSSFSAVDDFHKHVSGLYVTRRSTDSKFFSGWFAFENRGWGNFLLDALVQHEIHNFPLKRSPEGVFAHGELLLMDRDRWSAPAEGKKR